MTFKNIATLLVDTGIITALALASCNKDGAPIKPTPKKKVDSSAFYFTVKRWRLVRGEYLRGPNDWVTVATSGTLSGDTFTLNADSTFNFAEHNFITVTGTWKLSDHNKVLTYRYGQTVEIDTVDIITADTLRLISTQPFFWGDRYYNVSRDTYNH